jgi:pyrrolidone-carboxylate peptidase
MQILVYGFKPYADYSSNITEQVLARVDETAWLKKRVFEVRFDAAMFNDTLTQIRPDRIIGLGQHPRARKLRIERKAKNLRKSRGDKPVPILPGGPRDCSATLALPQNKLTTVTYDAGSYVCNYSMYLMARYCRETGAQYGFIHVPVNYDLRQLHQYLQLTFRQIQQNRIPGKL